MRQLAIWILQYRIRLAMRKLREYKSKSVVISMEYENLICHYYETIELLKCEKSFTNFKN